MAFHTFWLKLNRQELLADFAAASNNTGYATNSDRETLHSFMFE